VIFKKKFRSSEKKIEKKQCKLEKDQGTETHYFGITISFSLSLSLSLSFSLFANEISIKIIIE